jgi:5-methylcytosine-specific restriction protein A
MPTSPPRPCNAPQCVRLVTPPTRYCPLHTHVVPPQADHRPSSWRRGYDATWRGWRLAVLHAEPLCRVCRAAGRITAAVDVDHIVPKRDGGTESLANLQPLCHACHARKTKRETDARARPSQ